MMLTKSISSSILPTSVKMWPFFLFWNFAACGLYSKREKLRSMWELKVNRSCIAIFATYWKSQNISTSQSLQSRKSLFPKLIQEKSREFSFPIVLQIYSTLCTQEILLVGLEDHTFAWGFLSHLAIWQRYCHKLSNF